MKNREIITPEGEKVWISRSVAVCMALVIETEDDICVVITKRGKGCPDEVGKWCLPCGYLDYDETIPEAASREMYEETGIRISPSKWKLLDIDSDPRSNKQNVTHVYHSKICMFQDDFYTCVTTSNSEPNEVDDIYLLSLQRYIHKLDKEILAFNHSDLIKKLIFEYE